MSRPAVWHASLAQRQLTFPASSRLRIIVKFIGTHPRPISVDDKEASAILALSRVCRRLREVTLPVLWTKVNVWSIKELGRLRQLLRISPSIARRISTFRFAWQMGGDYWEVCDPYDQKEGTLLDLAFRDRLKMWENVKKTHGCTVEYEDMGEDPAMVYFIHDGKEYRAPGEPREVPGVEYCGLPVYDYSARRVGGNGPDGEGRDKLIKTPKQFQESIMEVMGKLTRLEELEWDTPVTPMSKEVFDRLGYSTTLTRLSLQLSTYRFNLHDCESSYALYIVAGC